MSPEQIQDAVLLYAQGQSLAKIAKAFGVDDGSTDVFASMGCRCGIRTDVPGDQLR